MQYCLLDKIIAIQPGVSLTASKLLDPNEQYLKDHFPRFPVMPGVLMLEAMYQAGAWLVRQTEGFVHAGVLLKEARNVKYSDFVTPGRELIVTVEWLKSDDKTTTLKAQGTVDGNIAVSARLILERFHIIDRIPTRGNDDAFARNLFRKVFQRLTADLAKTTAGAGQHPASAQLDLSAQPAAR